MIEKISKYFKILGNFHKINIMQLIFRIFKTKTTLLQYYTGQVIFVEDGPLTKIQDYWKLKKLNIFPKIVDNKNGLMFKTKQELYTIFNQNLDYYLNIAKQNYEVTDIYIISERNKIYSKSLIDKDYPEFLDNLNYNF